MTREVITLSVGQCGNQLAHDFWLRLSEMLGIDKTGCAPALTTEGSQFGRNVRYDVCFNEVEEGRFVARSLLLDLEPRIVNSILHGPQGALHSSKNAWVGSDGGGAGNLWTNGYAQGRLYADVIQEKVRAELEKADCAEAVNLLHSINGGTGSGLGSALLEFLRDAFPKKILQTYSVLPDCDASSSVVVQPYNAMLTFDRLTHCADAVHPIQNARLDAICTDTYQLAQPSVSTQNIIVADAVAALLAPLLFPSFANSSLASVLSSLVPLPKLHFLHDSVVSADFGGRATRGRAVNGAARLSLPELLKQTFSAQNYLCHMAEESHCYFALSYLYHGSRPEATMLASIEELRKRHRFNFSDWSVADVDFVISSGPASATTAAEKLHLALSNHTSFGCTVSRIRADFESLFSKRAFFDAYQAHAPFDLTEELKKCTESAGELQAELVTACN